MQTDLDFDALVLAVCDINVPLLVGHDINEAYV